MFRVIIIDRKYKQDLGPGLELIQEIYLRYSAHRHNLLSLMSTLICQMSAALLTTVASSSIEYPRYWNCKDEAQSFER